MENKGVYIALVILMIILGAYNYGSTSSPIKGFEFEKKTAGNSKDKLERLREKFHKFIPTPEEKKIIDKYLILKEDIPKGIDGGIENARINELDKISINDYFDDKKSEFNSFLFYGASGTGKTALVNDICSKYELNMINVNSDIGSGLLGEPQNKMTAVFTLAEKIQPCVIFFDEMDDIIKNRDDLSRSNQTGAVSTTLTVTFMKHMQKLYDNGYPGVYVIGATNNPEDLDIAVKGRIKLEIRFTELTDKEIDDIFNKKIKYTNVEKLLDFTISVNKPQIASLVSMYPDKKKKEVLIRGTGIKTFIDSCRHSVDGACNFSIKDILKFLIKYDDAGFRKLETTIKRLKGIKIKPDEFKKMYTEKILSGSYFGKRKSIRKKKSKKIFRKRSKGSMRKKIYRKRSMRKKIIS